ncbi:hypothetical protein B0T14DRAFT_565616 [Immersiella caudata]|uniref:Uncharacterized protein n=1 Tax=Immersiella caudata TaxID=314043 RepID=A0AA40C4D7_9PEZI|nr:hypothetical protein B0T14DRAFT_565616 [Immersiella caudata]
MPRSFESADIDVDLLEGSYSPLSTSSSFWDVNGDGLYSFRTSTTNLSAPTSVSSRAGSDDEWDESAEDEPAVQNFRASLSNGALMKVAELVERIRATIRTACGLSTDNTPLLQSSEAPKAGHPFTSDGGIRQATGSDDSSPPILTKQAPTPRLLDSLANRRERSPPPVVCRHPPLHPFPWPCLFALRNSQNHLPCLRHEHRTPRSLLHHLFRDHLRIPYCYRCGDTFDYLVDRNIHSNARTCEVVEPAPIFEGVGEGMIYELEALLSSWNEAGGSGRGLTDEERYARIWGVVFPGDDFRRRFPHGVVEDETVRMVQCVRGYWEQNGMGILEAEFEGKTEEEMGTLSAVVLDEILMGLLLRRDGS